MSIEEKLERIATALGGGLRHAGWGGGAETDRGRGAIDPADNVKQQPEDYDALLAAGNRERLLELCGEKGLVIGKGTKTPTLVNKLKEADDKAVKESPLTEPDPFDTAEEDPLAETKEITYDEVFAALQELRDKKGVPAVMAILQSHGGGVQKMSLLDPVNYQKVYEEAVK